MNIERPAEPAYCNENPEQWARIVLWCDSEIARLQSELAEEKRKVEAVNGEGK
jgi:hypothetical protein